MSLPLICSHDRHLLSEFGTGLSCGECGRQYPIRDGVVCTLDGADDFYEGAYKNQTRFLPRSERAWHVWPLWLINSGYPWKVRQFVPPGAAVVELGCAGGVQYFGRRYQMVGCDLSLSSLRGLVLYQRRIQADAATCIPLPDNSVDAVVSSYFWEHIRPIAKPHILQECRRILKPGGKIIFLYDVATENPLIRRHRRSNPHLYEKLFVQGDGHWGYQSSEENLAIFKNGNFEVVEHRGMEKTWIQSPSVYSKLSQFGTVGSGILAVAARLSQPPFFYLHATLLRLVDTLICPMLPGGWARVDMVVCRKSHP